MIKQIQYQKQYINYQVEGQGQALVLLHGFMEDLGMWNQHSEELSKHYQVLCIDLPGHGETGIWSPSHSMDFMAEIVKQAMDHEGIEKCVMIGHSMGGYVSLAFAEIYPDKLIGFGLFHSHSLADSEQDKKNRSRTIEIVNQEKGAFVNQFIPSLFAKENQKVFQKEIEQQIELANKMNPLGITAALEGMKERPMRIDVVAFSECPVLFILGKKDDRIAYEHVLAQASTAKLAQISILGNAGHMGWLEEKSKTIAIISGFMDYCLS